MSEPLPTIVIAREDPRQADVRALLDAADAFSLGLYPPEANHLLDIEELVVPEMRFFVARREGAAVGCGALWVHGRDWGEVKRMFVHPDCRGLRIGRLLLERIEATARAEGLGLLRLETGDVSHEALRLYERGGFARRGAFGDYPDHPASVFMEKPLAR
ncbi:MAG: GNAT family N-acetyltransferase [Hyphomicrobiaceae bacterium]